MIATGSGLRLVSCYVVVMLDQAGHLDSGTSKSSAKTCHKLPFLMPLTQAKLSTRRGPTHQLFGGLKTKPNDPHE
jgi:hypothetical protein